MEPNTKRYVLFDLDGTLLPLNTDSFLEAYIHSITAHFSHVVEPSLFSKQLLASSFATIADATPGVTNRDKFFADFFPKINRRPDELMPLFDEFYLTKFSSLASTSVKTHIGRELVTTALGKGLGIVLATNPIFPREAVQERMRWAQIEDLPWDLVTSYEDTCFCKPFPQYFREILGRIGAEPSQCLHIGNDLSEDMAAQKVGIPVVMVTDYLINKTNGTLEACLYHGTLAEVVAWAKTNL